MSRATSTQTCITWQESAQGTANFYSTTILLYNSTIRRIYYTPPPEILGYTDTVQRNIDQVTLTPPRYRRLVLVLG